MEIRDRRRGFLWVNNEIIDDYAPRLGAVSILVYLYMSRFANNNSGVCWPSQEKMAEFCGCNERTVRRATAELEKLGLIHVERRKNGTITQNYYTLLDPPPTGQICPIGEVPTGHQRPDQPDTTAPLTRLIEQDLNTSPSASDDRKLKHQTFKELIFKCYNYLNDENPPWDGSDAKQLDSIIKSKPDLTPEKFHDWLISYAKSENINPAARPRVFLTKISDYAAGPLNKFGRPDAA